MKKKKAVSPIASFNSKVTTTVSISLVLFLLGLIVFLSLFTNNLSAYIKETLSFDIVLQDNTGKDEIQKLQSRLKAASFTKSVAYVSKEDAIQDIAADLGQNPEEFLGFNPLPDMLVVHLKADYANTDSLSVIEKQVKGFSTNIKETEYRKEMLQVIIENITKIGLALLIIAGVLLFISVALINNTIRLMIYSKRFLIRTMQLVGANKGFICKPFVLANLGIGIIASVIASGLLYWLLYFLSGNIRNLDELLTWPSLLTVFGSVLVLGSLITTVATYFAVNKYVRADVDDLYKM